MPNKFETFSLDTSAASGNLKEGGEGRRPEPGKTRRATGPAANSLNDFILRLHSFARDWAEVSDDAGERAQAALLNELAALLKEEYDLRHGK